MKLFFYVFLIIIFLILSLIHFYWAFGGKWGVQNVIPIDSNGAALLSPSSLITIVVALGLLSLSIFYLIHSNLISIPISPTVLKIGSYIIPLIFIIRAMGDFKYVGFFKTVKGTEFATMDSFYFSPLCLIIGAIGFLIVYLK